MSDILLPKLDRGFEAEEGIKNSPGWLPTKKYEKNEAAKPLIRCNCGVILSIPEHTVHSDGKVTASLFHDKDFKDPVTGTIWHPACGWHVFIKLENWTGEEFGACK